MFLNLLLLTLSVLESWVDCDTDEMPEYFCIPLLPTFISATRIKIPPTVDTSIAWKYHLRLGIKFGSRFYHFSFSLVRHYYPSRIVTFSLELLGIKLLDFATEYISSNKLHICKDPQIMQLQL